jgi:glycosyltransferase involved in cell wall biosynthesis
VVTYIAQANRGNYAARNAGVRAAHGELVAFLDADDLWEPTKLAQEVALFDAHPDIGACFTNFTVFGARALYRTGFEERGAALLHYPRQPLTSDSYLITSASLVEDFLRNRAFPKPSAFMVRRACLERVGPFDETLPMAGDTQMFLRLARYFRFAYIVCCLARRRLRTDSLSYATDLLYFARHIRLFETLERWIPLSPAERVVAKRALADYRFSVGYINFSQDRLGLARRYFWGSLTADFTLKALLYLCASFLPLRVVRRLRSAKARCRAMATGSTAGKAGQETGS